MRRLPPLLLILLLAGCSGSAPTDGATVELSEFAIDASSTHYVSGPLAFELMNAGDESGSVVATLGSVDTELEGVENRESLRPLLQALPEREKRILQLRFFEHKTQSEIAAEVGLSQMHVSRLLARTLSQLREQLLDDY